MYYVYILRSIAYPEQLYVGCTQDLKKRLSNHNSGTTPHTEKYKPWRRMKKFLKSGSGNVFVKRRLW